MARLLLLCLVLCCSLATTSAARNLLITSDPNTSWLTYDQSIPASSPSPTTPENGGDSTTVNEPSSGTAGSRPASASPWLTETKKNGEVAIAPSRSEDKSPAEEGQQHEAHRSSANAVGGDVILGGLATAFLAAIVCYIRVTRRRDVVDEEKVSPMCAS